KRARKISLLQNVGRYGHAEQVALHFIAIHQAQETRLVFRFDAFRHHVEFQRMRQIDDCGDQYDPFRPGCHVGYERAVYLQGIDGQLRQVTERGEAGTEIVDGDGDAHGPDRFQAVDIVLDILHDQAFGDLQFQSDGRLRIDGNGPLDLACEVAIVQLQRRYVHCDSHSRQPHGPPTQVIFYCLAERPASDLVDQSGFLEHGNEVSRADQPQFRIVPANQGFDAGNEAAGQIYLRLVVEYEPLVVESLVQLIFQGEFAGDRLGHFLLVKQIRMHARLGLLERRLRAPEQGIGVGTVVGKHRDAEPDCDPERRSIENERVVEKPPHRLLQETRNIAVNGDLWKNDGELVDPYSRQEIRPARVARQPLSNLSQQRVSGRPAKTVVDIAKSL